MRERKQLINDPYTALNQILQSNTAITSLLGTYTGTTIPLIKGGVLAESEGSLPALAFYNNSLDPDFNIEDSTFTINCYAETERESFLVARTIIKELNGNQQTALGYPVTTTCSIIASVPDPVANEVNKVVEIRLYNIGGAI